MKYEMKYQYNSVRVHVSSSIINIILLRELRAYAVCSVYIKLWFSRVQMYFPRLYIVFLYFYLANT